MMRRFSEPAIALSPLGIGSDDLLKQRLIVIGHAADPPEVIAIDHVHEDARLGNVPARRPQDRVGCLGDERCLLGVLLQVEWPPVLERITR